MRIGNGHARNNLHTLKIMKHNNKVVEFFSLGSKVSKNGNRSKARHADNIRRSELIRNETKTWIFMNRNVKVVLLYFSQRWAQKKSRCWKIQTFVKRCLRRISKLSGQIHQI